MVISYSGEVIPYTTLLHQNDYTYDLDGQRLSNTITGSTGSARTEGYGYDNLNRLTSVNYGDGQTQGYSFDAMGNRLGKTDSSTGNESYAYDAANRLTSRTVASTTTSVTSDANGNTLSDSARTNTWDSQNRLITCASSASGSATTSTFVYGSDGLRKRGSVTNADGTSTRTDYIYDSSMMVEQVVQHFNSSGTAIDTATAITYMQGPSGPLYRKSSAVTDPSWYVYDGLGSVVGEVDVNGNLTASKLFDVYGLTRSVSGSPTTRQGFVGSLGHESDDETGLIYMQHRYCDPGVGRFISEDGGRDGTNLYIYVRDNPVNGWDPNGKNAILGASCVAYILQMWKNCLSSSQIAIIEGNNVEAQIELLQNLCRSATLGTQNAIGSVEFDLGGYNNTNDVSKAGGDIAIGAGIMAQLAYTALFINMNEMLALLQDSDASGFASMVAGKVVNTPINQF